MVLSLLPLSVLLAGTKPATGAIFLDFIWDKWRKVHSSNFISLPTKQYVPMGKQSAFPLQNMEESRIETPFTVWKRQEPLFNSITKEFQFACCFCYPIQSPLHNNVYKDQCFTPTGNITSIITYFQHSMVSHSGLAVSSKWSSRAILCTVSYSNPFMRWLGHRL